MPRLTDTSRGLVSSAVFVFHSILAQGSFEN